MAANGKELVPIRIRLPYATEDEFVEKYGTNVARGGIFIATRALKDEGTPLQFELVLSDGGRLMRGEGVVAKVQVDEGGGRRGMTVRFVKLDARSKALVDRVLAHRSGIAEVAAPEPPQTEPTPAPAESPRAERPAAAAISAPKRRRSVDVPVVSAPGDKGEEVVLGIDLGTTNCRVAVYQDGAARLIPIGQDGRATGIPSVVALDDKRRFLVGHRAKGQMLVDPRNTVFGAKRLLGRRFRSRRVRELAKRFPYTLAADPEGDAGVELRGKVYTLSELTALLLKELKESAQNRLGRELSKAVLCVPAYFNDRQRAAVLAAGRSAGLEILRIVNEPSAVALAFGFGRGLARKRVLVYDLGGGTFDASVIELTGDDLEVVTTGGDNFLGGMDFDLRVAAELTEQLEAKEGLKLDGSLHSQQRVRDAAEQAKIQLSDAEKASIHVPFMGARDDGSPVDLRTELTRPGLEALTGDLVERTIELTQAVLEAGGLAADSLDEVLLVGGQSRAPLVRRRLEELVGRTPRTDVDAHAAVALGAAILGQALARAERGKSGVSLSEVLSAPIGIGVKGGGMRRVLDRNTRLPAEKSIALPVREGDALAIAAFQGDASTADENEYLGSIHFKAEKAGDLTLRFAVSSDGTLNLSATAPGGKTNAIALATTEASDETRAALLAQAPLPGDDSGEATSGFFKGLKKLFGSRSA